MKVRIITGLICAFIVIMLLVFTGLGYQGVMSIPMLAVIRNGELVAKSVGAKPKPVILGMLES